LQPTAFRMLLHDDPRKKWTIQLKTSKSWLFPQREENYFVPSKNYGFLMYVCKLVHTSRVQYVKK
jgi:hypothetical protein